MQSHQSGRRGPRAYFWSRVAIVLGVVAALWTAGFDAVIRKAEAQDFFEQLFGWGQDHRYRSGASHAPRRYERRHIRTSHPATDRWGFSRRGDGAVRRAAPDGRDSDVIFESASASRSYCVRECDGYFFPVGLYAGASDSASHQKTCNKLCPGAKTALYVLRPGSDKIEDAAAARGGALYSRLVAALRDREGAGKTCSCRSASSSEAPMRAIYQDFTLRRGDAVMTPHGMQVFHGGPHYPHTIGDFRPIAESRDVPERTRRLLAALERASKHARGAGERRAKLFEEHRSQSGGRARHSGD